MKTIKVTILLQAIGFFILNQASEETITNKSIEKRIQ